MAKTERKLADGQRAYEARRAAKAGVSLDRWLTDKDKRERAEEKAALKAVAPPKPSREPGWLKRLLERARKPL